MPKISNLKNKKIVVTGGAGFIGSHIAEYMKKKGSDVYIIDNFSPYYSIKIKEKTASILEKQGIKIFRKNLVKDKLDDILENTDFVIHCAAQPGILQDVSFEKYEQNNLIATQKLLDSVQNIKTLKCFINISTSSVYGLNAKGSEDVVPTPASYYGVTKLASEQLALSYYRQNKIPVCSLRLFSVYGERERPEKLIPQLINSITKNKSFTLYEGSKNHIRSYTYVGDIVNGVSKCIDNYQKCIGEILNLGSEKTHKTSEVISIVEKLTDNRIDIKIVEKRTGDQKETRANIEKARRILDFKPQTSLEEGVKKYIEWYKENNL